MKKLVFFLYIIISFVLVACNVSEPTSPLDLISEQVQIIYARGDNAQSVTQKFTLPTQVGDATITWASNNSDAINIDGSTVTVTRSNADVTVTITATITLDGESKDKPFTIIVKALPTNPATKYTITWIIDGNQSTTEVDENTMPSKENPSKEGYTFVGWNPTIVVATANATYTAVFEPITSPATKYTITWIIDGVSSTTEVNEGQLPTKANPTKTGYTFVGWNPSIVAATSNATYTAVFELIQQEGEIDGNELDQLVGYPIYSLIPKIFSEDYEFFDNDATEYGYSVDIYIDLFDWTEADMLDYDEALDALFNYSNDDYGYIVGDYFIDIYVDEESYNEPVISINIFKYSDEEVEEFNPTQLNQMFGFNIYALMPTIISSDYSIIDESGEVYPIDIFIDLFDWYDEEYDAYFAELENLLELDSVEETFKLGNYYIWIYLEEEVYEFPVYSIRIYGFEDGPTDDSFDGDALDALFGEDIYQLIPDIITGDYAMEDYGSADYPIDIYIDLFDWTSLQYQDYLLALEDGFDYVETEFFDAYKVGSFYILIYLDENSYEIPVYSINIFTVADEEETPVEGEMITITSKGQTNVAMQDGSVNEYVNIVTGGPTINVIHTKNGGTVATIFNNSQSEIRLYHSEGAGNGNALTFTIQSGYLITGIGLNVGSNIGLSINGGPSNTQTNTSITQSFGSGLQSVVIQNVSTAGSGNVGIKSITIYYGAPEEPIETWSEAIDDLESQLSINSLDALLPEIPNLSNFNVTSINGGYTLTATAVSNTATLMDNYKNSLLELGFVEDGQVLRYQLSESLGIEVTLTSNGNDLSISINKYYPNVGDGDLESLGLMKSITDFELEEFGKSGLPSSGSYHVLVIPVEIKNDPFPVGYANVLDKVFNGTEAETGWESVSSFYRQSSFGKLDITFVIAPKYISQYDKNHYEGHQNNDALLIEEALYGLNSQIDYSQYDFNSDGVLDAVIFIYSTEYDYDVEPWWAWVSVMDSRFSPLGGKEVEYYMWASYHFILDSIPGYNGLIYNAETLIHEMGHLLGIDDLYSGTHDFGPLGGWDMMDWNAGDHGPFNKLVFGWLNPLVATNGVYNVTLDSYSLDDDGENSVLLIPYNSNNFADGDAFDEYLLVMFYTPGGLYNAHYNTNISVENAGVVIYHVDARMNSNIGFWDYYMRNNNDNTSSFLVQILEADKNNSIPSASNEISQSDLLTSGTINLSTYKWNQGGANINVTITLTEALTNNMTSTTIQVSVNA